MNTPTFQEALASPKFLVIGHRGILNHPSVPENTIEAFRWALDAGADGFEFDLRYGKNKKIIVFHDKTLIRLFGENKRVKDISTRELSAYRFLNQHSENFSIPTLEDVFREFSDSCYYNLEIKSFNIFPYFLVYRIYQLIKRYNVLPWVWVSSFNPMVLVCSKIVNPYIPTAFLFSHYGIGEKIIIRLPFVDILHPENQLIRFLFEFKRFRKPIFYWGVNTESELEFLYRHKIAGVITDRIDLANKIKHHNI